MKKILFLFICLISLLGFGCQPPNSSVTNTNSVVNSNSPNNAGLNAPITNINSVNSAGTDAASGLTIDSKEPEKYQADVNLKVETTGEQKATSPSLQAKVARLNDDRRMEFNLPNGEKLVYLDKGGKQFVISPSRKQYAELNKESLGFEVRRMLMPSQIVNQVKNVRGVEQVGEEQFNGRTVIKYRYGATTETKTQAGKVDTESFFSVDKETGLPLRSETVSQSQTGNVQGISGVKIVTEMTNLQTDADAALFAEPVDFQKVAPEQVRGQIDLFMNMAMTVVGQMLKSSTTQPTVSPTANN